MVNVSWHTPLFNLTKNIGTKRSFCWRKTRQAYWASTRKRAHSTYRHHCHNSCSPSHLVVCLKKDFFQVSTQFYHMDFHFIVIFICFIVEGTWKVGAKVERHWYAYKSLSIEWYYISRLAVSQSVKEVVQSLVDDGLVQYDKIGSSNCCVSFTHSSWYPHICASISYFRLLPVFWSFPSQQGALVGSEISCFWFCTESSISSSDAEQIGRFQRSSRELSRPANGTTC
jgi:hypothetical protein